MDRICLITGVGPGTGSALVKRFREGGYQVAMLARSLDRLEAIASEDDACIPFVCDVSNTEQLARTFENITQQLGAPSIVVHNAVGAARGNYMDVSIEQMRQAFEINTVALLELARLSTPAMIKRGSGAILATGNTAAYRGRANFAGFAPTKAAQRVLMESIAREAGPKGIHAAYVAIDAVIDLEWTRKVFSDKPDDFFCQPADIAEECYRLAHQPKSAWTFESVIRPFGETW